MFGRSWMDKGRPLTSGRGACGRSSRRIRVAYLITDLEVGGVPLHLYRLVTRLPSERFDARVISLASPGPVGRMLQEAGVPVAGCGARSARDLAALWRLARLLRATSPDVLHALLFHANLAARVVGPLTGISPRRILCEIQTAEIERKWHLKLDNLTCRLCRWEIGNSPSVIEHLRLCAHVPISRLRCEWGAVDVAAIRSAEPIPREALGWPTDRPVILWVGRLDPVKGFEEMLEAFRLVLSSRAAALVLVGEGPYRSQIERLIRAHALENAVLMMGQRSDVFRLLRSADLFLFCSRTEGLPNALLEAMAAGLPIVATNVPGSRDLVRDGQTGLLATARSAREIADRVLALLADPTRAGRMGAAAHRWVRAHADLTELGSRWSQVYEHLCVGC